MRISQRIGEVFSKSKARPQSLENHRIKFTEKPTRRGSRPVTRQQAAEWSKQKWLAATGGAEFK